MTLFMKCVKKSLLIFFLLLPNTLLAREEIVLSMPAGGTVYLGDILSHISNFSVIRPSSTDSYMESYYHYWEADDIIVMGHLFHPVIYNFIENQLFPQLPKLILIRDPRDIVLSAIEYIDTFGVNVWPCLPDIIDNAKWHSSTLEEKIIILLQYNTLGARSIIASGLEHAKNFVESGGCTLVKFENLSPKSKDRTLTLHCIQTIAAFFNINIDPNEAHLVARKLCQLQHTNASSPTTFRDDKIYRYKEVDDQIRSLLNRNLKKYIQFFNYEM